MQLPSLNPVVVPRFLDLGNLSLSTVTSTTLMTSSTIWVANVNFHRSLLLNRAAPWPAIYMAVMLSMSSTQWYQVKFINQPLKNVFCVLLVIQGILCMPVAIKLHLITISIHPPITIHCSDGGTSIMMTSGKGL
jgi:hypothetical protein